MGIGANLHFGVNDANDLWLNQLYSNNNNNNKQTTCGCPQVGRKISDAVDSGLGNLCKTSPSFTYFFRRDNNGSNSSYHFVECWSVARCFTYSISNSQDSTVKPLCILPFCPEELSSQRSDVIFLRFYRPVWFQSPGSLPHSIPCCNLQM